MPATAIVTARLEPELRASALKVIEGSGLTSSDVIRRMYEYIAIMGEVPEFIKTAEYDVQFKNRIDPFKRMLGWIEEGPFAQLDFSGLTDEEIAAELGRDEAYGN